MRLGHREYSLGFIIVIDLKNTMYEKRRLPIKRVSLKCSVSEKIIKTSKKFIISVVVILDKNFRNLKLWVRG